MASEGVRTQSGLSGTLRLIAVFAVVALAALAGLLVFDVITRDAFAQWSTKILFLGGIAVLAVLVIWALLRGGGRQ